MKKFESIESTSIEQWAHFSYVFSLFHRPIRPKHVFEEVSFNLLNGKHISLLQIFFLEKRAPASVCWFQYIINYVTDFLHSNGMLLLQSVSFASSISLSLSLFVCESCSLITYDHLCSAIECSRCCTCGILWSPHYYSSNRITKWNQKKKEKKKQLARSMLITIWFRLWHALCARFVRGFESDLRQDTLISNKHGL